MELRPICTESDHRWALQEIERRLDAPHDSADGDYIDALATLVHAYEQKRWPMERPEPREMIQFYMEQNDRTQADLSALLGSRSRASEILNGKRSLTLNQIKTLHKAWRIPLDCLVGDMEDA